MKPETLVLGLKFLKQSQLVNAPTFKNAEEYEFMKDFWCESLSDITDESFVRACKMLATELKFFPVLSEVKAKCLEVQNGKQKTGMELWEEIKRKMMRVSSPYANPEDREKVLATLTDPAERKVAETFDWKAYGMDDEANVGFHRAHFVKLYDGIKERVKFDTEFNRLEEIAAPEQKLAGLIGNIGKEIN